VRKRRNITRSLVEAVHALAPERTVAMLAWGRSPEVNGVPSGKWSSGASCQQFGKASAELSSARLDKSSGVLAELHQKGRSRQEGVTSEPTTAYSKHYLVGSRTLSKRELFRFRCCRTKRKHPNRVMILERSTCRWCRRLSLVNFGNPVEGIRPSRPASNRTEQVPSMHCQLKIAAP
jgi:hypothetical protein